MRDLLENLREFKNIRKIRENERPFLQISLFPLPKIKEEEEKQESKSKVIIIDLLEEECQTEL